MEHHAHHLIPSFYAHIVLMLYGMGMIIYLIPQQNKARGSYLVREDENGMLFRKPLHERRAILAAVGFLVLLFLNVLAITVGSWNLLPVYTKVGLAYLCITALGLPVLFLYKSGQDDIHLDPSQRTYERTVGWPWKPATKFGTFDGIKGVCISPQNTVLLLMKKPGLISKGVVLSSSGTKAEASALVEKLRLEFEFPILPYPKM